MVSHKKTINVNQMAPQSITGLAPVSAYPFALCLIIIKFSLDIGYREDEYIQRKRCFFSSGL